MGTASIHEGVRRMRFSSLLERTEAKELTQEAAAEVLGISVRTFQRWAERYEAEGDDGLVDRRMGRRSPRRAPQEELERMLGLFRDKYADFTVKHFHEQLQKRHGYMLGYTVTKLALHAAGLVRKAPKRSAHRKKRPRRPLRGMLLHQDGSRHVWIEGLPARDLIVTMDDATSEVYSMVLVEEEGTASTFQALREVIGEHGLSARSTPTAAAIISLPQKLARRSRRRNKPRWDGLCRILGSSISQPIRRRRAGAPSGCSARCRIGCRRSCGWPGSRRSKLPTRG
ncbi:helix-turn-helix domain-containing protein [Bradyrhizobium sp. 13971]